MNISLDHKELISLVQNHISESLGLQSDRLKVSFTKRGTQTDTSIEILKPGEPKSIIDLAIPMNDEIDKEIDKALSKITNDALREPTIEPEPQPVDNTEIDDAVSKLLK